jgi:hypothetical protein
MRISFALLCSAAMLICNNSTPFILGDQPPLFATEVSALHEIKHDLNANCKVYPAGKNNVLS